MICAKLIEHLPPFKVPVLEPDWIIARVKKLVELQWLDTKWFQPFVPISLPFRVKQFHSGAISGIPSINQRQG